MWCHWWSNSVGTSRTEGRALTNCANCVLLLRQLFPTVSVCITKLGNIGYLGKSNELILLFTKKRLMKKRVMKCWTYFFYFLFFLALKSPVLLVGSLQMVWFHVHCATGALFSPKVRVARVYHAQEQLWLHSLDRRGGWIVKVSWKGLPKLYLFYLSAV